MKTWIKVLIGIAVFIGIIIVGSCSAIIGVNNECVRLENTVKAQYDQNKNNYDNYFKKIKEIAQVPDMYVDGMKKIYDAEMAGRYGKDGSKAMFQFIKEHNSNFDSSLYKNIQQEISAGRKDFEINQKSLIDKKRVYETKLESLPSGIIAKFMGFPKVDLKSLAIITSDETENAFKAKKSEPIKIK